MFTAHVCVVWENSQSHLVVVMNLTYSMCDVGGGGKTWGPPCGACSHLYFQLIAAG